MKDYWSTVDQFFTAFHFNILKQDRLYCVLRFLHFSDNKNEHDKTEENSTDWKIRAVLDKLSDSYAKYYSLTDHLAVDEIILLFKGRVILKQNIPKKQKQFGIKLYKLCDSKLYTNNMTVCACKDRKCATPSMTATHATVTELTARIENVQHKLYMDNFFSFPLDNLHTKTINCHRTVEPNRKGMLKNFGYKINLKRGDKD